MHRHNMATAVCGLILAVLICVVNYSDGHVALVFPPARKYDLDFLDSSRTKAPCGMPKGNVKTSFLSGSKFNVSWHLGYPHKGGFKLQLLDQLERPVLDLTPSVQGSEFISNDATAQTYAVELPPDFTCINCTLRLIRQALEWGVGYKFWSCADVDIKIRKEFRENCGGHGRYLLGKCKCDRLYYGSVCQFRDECLENSDCGSQGICVDIDATTAPRKQCYCQLGYFGPGCTRRSPVKSTEIDFDLYTEKKLSDTFTLYWRILKEHKELEAVMVVNGTSYAALGWRPRSLTKSCKNFPQIGPVEVVTTTPSTTQPEPEPKSEPEPSSEPTTEYEPTSEPEPNAVETERKSTYNRRSALLPSPALPYQDVDKVETSVSYKVSSSQGRRKRETSESTPSAEPEPRSEPEPTSEPKSVPEPTSEPKSEPEPTSEPNSEPEPNLETKSEPEPITEPTAEPISEPVPKSEPEPSSEPEPTSEPKSQPKPNPEPKSEPEPNPEPKSEPETNPEPKFEPEPNPEPKSEPEPNPEPKSEPEPSSEPTAEPNKSTHVNVVSAAPKVEDGAAENLNAYTPRHDFNPMDCTDIIIGSARGTASRIGDYYTRDRSTPRMDNFWGGKNDLTAALGFEKDGITTILFRKKLEAKEPSDHTIEEDLMHVIFAQGQEKGKYVHIPKSGVETSQVSEKDFYKPDELKYHGHESQRGVISLNFFDKKVIMAAGTAATSDSAQNTDCGGEWKIPKGCSPENLTCEYSAKWELIPRKDEIRFTLTTSNTDTWTGIAFSNDEKMSQTDAVLGWVDKTGRPFLMDTWISGYTQPFLDSNQNIYNTSGRIENGVTTLSFTRKRITNDPRDLDFTDDRCLFMMFPVKGGAFNSVNKKIRKHEVLPVVSTERICIKSCGNDDLYDYQTTTESPGIDYKVQVKVVDLGENFVPPKPGTVQYDDLSNSISNNFQPVFKSLPGYRRIVIDQLKSESNDIVAIMNVQLDKAVLEKGRALSSSDMKNTDEQVHKIVQESVGSGRVGNLKVDPQYLVFEPQSRTTNLIPDADGSTISSGWFDMPSTKLYIVLGCIAALVLVALVQAGCTVYKATGRRRANRHKDHLIPNSAWKDYSSNTNYAFDSFEREEPTKKQQHQQHHQQNGNGRSAHPPQSRPRSNPPRPQGRPPSVPPQGHGGDSRSLQRPRSALLPPNDRSTFSLPRTQYDRHTVGAAKGGQMPADFYFMPSQRKYSGEVVRVYVDYNGQKREH
ncbi:uncharacterized protein LOC115882976 isoform X2 [Sitophilus oryzae]|uniref:Uncharacterized protein LOC115882976 isoform X2 n=1 Tax=Sitophilus oryzae TaxID=7048 RepID=A0A6J2Y042_SITOR|nr:uncharacterized protein LOC115882976 isoform X2 [Sitophilus oryzae]